MDDEGFGRVAGHWAGRGSGGADGAERTRAAQVWRRCGAMTRIGKNRGHESSRACFGRFRRTSVFAALTGSGLAAAAGLNAWIPFMLVAMTARFSELIELPVEYDWVISNWAIGAGAVLLVAELVLDKVPLVDHANDLVQTLVRPTVGG